MELITDIIIFAFLIGMLLIGLYHSRNSTLDSYTSESNKVSLFSLIATLVGTSFGGGVIVGMVTMGFEAGVVGIIVGISYLVGFCVLAIFSKKIKDAISETGGTLIDFLSQRFGTVVGKTAAIVFSVVLFLFASAQFVAFASFLAHFFEIEFSVAIFISAGFLILYTTLGGFRSVVITDSLQFVFLVITTALLSIPLLNKSAIGSIESLPPKMLNGTAYGVVFLVGAALFLWPTLLARIDIWQRIGSGKSNRTVKVALISSGILIFIFFSLFSIIGMLAKAHNAGYNSQTVVFEFIQEMLPAVGMPICFLAILAAVMSSADSILNVLAISSCEMFGISKKNHPNNEKHLLKKLRIATIIVGVVSVVVAFVFPDIVDLNVGGISTLLVFVLPILAALFGWKIRPKIIIVSLIAGVVVTTILFPLMPKMAFLPGLLISALVFIIGILLYRQPKTSE